MGVMASAADLRSCADELTDVKRALERHLGDFHNLLAHYDAAEAQSWYENEAFWLGQWKAAAERCRYTVPRKGQFAKEWEELRVIHEDLRNIEQTYTKGLLEFAQQQGPRLDSIRGRLASGGRPSTTSSRPLLESINDDRRTHHPDHPLLLRARSARPRCRARPGSRGRCGPPKGPSFAELGLHADVMRAVDEMGFSEPMPVQARRFR